jgi:hypothetical protein
LLLGPPVTVVTRLRRHFVAERRLDAANSRLLAFVVGRRQWALRGLQPWRIQHVGRVVMRFGPHALQHYCVDLATTLLLAACLAVPLAGRCSPVTAWAVFAVHAGSTALRVWRRPYASHFRNATNAASSALCAISVFLQASRLSSDETHVRVAAASVYLLCGAQLTAIVAVAATGRLGAMISVGSPALRRPLARAGPEQAAVANGNQRLAAVVLLAALRRRTDRTTLLREGPNDFSSTADEEALL